MERKLLCYTRLPMEDAVYAARLAYSMHLALKREDGGWEPLNHNYGILFARAVQREDGVLCAKSLKNPWLFELKDGGYGVAAVRTEADGEQDQESRGAVLLFTSNDLLQYEERGLLPLGKDEFAEDVECGWDKSRERYAVRWKAEDGTWYETLYESLEAAVSEGSRGSCASLAAAGKSAEKKAAAVPSMPGIESAVPRSILSIPEETAQRLRCRLLVPEHIRTEVPENICADSPEELAQIGAEACYSDGSRANKRVDWNFHEADWNKPGIYRVTGRVYQDHIAFPIAVNRADPCACRWKGSYYFIATNDADDNHSLYVRKADTLPGLVDAPEQLVLDTSMYPHMRNLLWAPEFHEIRGRMYLFLAGTPQHFHNERSHVMQLKDGGDPAKASDWGVPMRVVRKDGSPLFDRGITLDMTCFEAGGRYYVVWAQRQFDPTDQGSWLYIAETDPEKPWQLISDPVLISMPEYGWENNHTYVDEGPFALIRGGKIHLMFSAAAVDSTYVVGLMTADADGDLLDAGSWTKANYPLLTSLSVPGQYGPGHNSYLEDEYGTFWNFYHGRPGLSAPRCAGIRRIHFGIEGNLILDMTEEQDLKPELAQVSVQVSVRK